jgi:hypothetical protein
MHTGEKILRKKVTINNTPINQILKVAGGRTSPKQERVIMLMIMNCLECPKYNNGHGTKDCLKCKKYKHFQINYTQRPQISIEILPAAILESIADTAHGLEAIDALRKLPLDCALPFAMKYILNAKNQEAAKYLKISVSHYIRKNKFSLNKIRELLGK